MSPAFSDAHRHKSSPGIKSISRPCRSPRGLSDSQGFRRERPTTRCPKFHDDATEQEGHAGCATGADAVRSMVEPGATEAADEVTVMPAVACARGAPPITPITVSTEATAAIVARKVLRDPRRACRYLPATAMDRRRKALDIVPSSICLYQEGLTPLGVHTFMTTTLKLNLRYRCLLALPAGHDPEDDAPVLRRYTRRMYESLTGDLRARRLTAHF